MGLIILPAVIFWLVALFFSCRAGFYLLVDKPLFPYALSVMLIAVLAALLYVGFGLFSFKGRSEVWAFEIPSFFLFNKYAALMFTCAAVVYYFCGHLAAGDLVKAACFVVAFSVALGNLAGCFGSGAFISKYNISQTY